MSDTYAEAKVVENEPAQAQTAALINIRGMSEEDKQWLLTELLKYVKFTDYATGAKAGVVRAVGDAYGISINATNGNISLSTATDAELKTQTTGKAVKVNQISKSVKVGVTTNTEELTDEDRVNACDWLGALSADKEYLHYVEEGWPYGDDGTPATAVRFKTMHWIRPITGKYNYNGDLGITNNAVLFEFYDNWQPGDTEGVWHGRFKRELKGKIVVNTTWILQEGTTDYYNITGLKAGDYFITTVDGSIGLCLQAGTNSFGTPFALIKRLGKLQTASLSRLLACQVSTVPLYDAENKNLKPSSIVEMKDSNGVPYVNINLNVPNESSKTFLPNSFLMGLTHYADGFIQKNGHNLIFPQLTKDETLATEAQLEEKIDMQFHYSSYTGKAPVYNQSFYVVFGKNLTLHKKDGTVVASGAKQMFFMTAPYGEFVGGTLFVAMGAYVTQGSFSITNLKIPIEGLQAELDDGAYITEKDSADTFYVSRQTKGIKPNNYK